MELPPPPQTTKKTTGGSWEDSESNHVLRGEDFVGENDDSETIFFSPKGKLDMRI